MRLDLAGATRRIVMLICSEAQNVTNIPQCELAVIVSCDDKPQNFRATIDGFLRQQNHTPVAYCNHGAYGHSQLHATWDRRFDNWYLDSFPQGLPAGEHVVAFDVNLGSVAPQIGVTNPTPAWHLVSLASIEYADPKSLKSYASEFEAVRVKDTPEERYQLLLDLSQRVPATDVVRSARVRHLAELERKGSPEATEAWQALGRDLYLSGVPRLKAVEGELAALCLKELSLIAGKIPPAARDTYMEFLALCGAAAAESPARVSSSPAPISNPVIGRDDDIQPLLRLLQAEEPAFVILNGLDGIGKSTLARAALAASGIAVPLAIEIMPASTPGLLTETLRERAGVESQSATLREICDAIFRRNRALLLYRVERLLEKRSVWLEPTLEGFFEILIESVRDNRGKLLLVASQWLPDFGRNRPDAVRHVHGLYKKKVAYGVALFNTHLTRSGIPTDFLALADKERLVNRLGGHPQAIIHASSLPGVEIDKITRGSLGKSLRVYVDAIAEGLKFTLAERMVLGMLAQSPFAVPVQVFADIGGDGLSQAAIRLETAGAIELESDRKVSIAGILRSVAEDYLVPKSLMLEFHRVTSLLARQNARGTELYQSDYHARLAGIPPPNFPFADAAIASADKLFRAREYDRAYAVIMPLLQAERVPISLHKLAALISLRRGDLKAALDHARSVFAIPEHGSLFIDLAKIALTMYRHDPFIDDLIGLAREYSLDTVEVLVVEGRLALRQKRWKNAEEAFTRATELSKSNGWPFFYLGKTLAVLGDMPGAIDVLERGESLCDSVRHSQGRVAIRCQLAWVYLNTGEMEAARYYVTSLARHDYRPEVGYLTLVYELMAGSEKAVTRAFRKLQAARPKDTADRCRVHLSLGLFLEGQRRLSEAVQELRVAHQTDPGDVYVMTVLLRVLRELTRFELAEKSQNATAYMRECVELARSILGCGVSNGMAEQVIAEWSDAV